MAGTETATDSDRLSIHVAALLASQEQSDPRDLICHGATLQRIQLANLLLGAARAGGIVHHSGHAGLDDTGADGVDPDPGSGELVAHRLRDADHGGLGRRVIG